MFRPSGQMACTARYLQLSCSDRDLASALTSWEDAEASEHCRQMGRKPRHHPVLSSPTPDSSRSARLQLRQDPDQTLTGRPGVGPEGLHKP